MAKATAPDTTALSVSEAATAIVALINSRAQSPWPQEIEAIIARAGPADEIYRRAPPLSSDQLAYRKLLMEEAEMEEREDHPVSDEEFEAHSERTAAIEDKVWATPARTLADLLFRAEIALYHENGVMESIDKS